MTRRELLTWSGMIAVQALLAGCERNHAATPAASATKPTEKPKIMNPETVSVKVFNRNGELVGPLTMPKVVKTDAQWQAQLTASQYEIARDKGTERPFCGNLLDNHKTGVYVCICCGLPLFSSDSKFSSGTGWPSFFQPIAKENVTEHSDTSLLMTRTEILCSRCDCHLGHVFDDGPRPTGLRFCVNSESMRFVDSNAFASLADPVAVTSATNK